MLRTNVRDLDLSGVPDYVVDAVCVGSMVIGMREITPETLDEWCVRAYMAQTVHEPWLMINYVPTMLTREHAARFIGFRANISPITPTKFNAQMIKDMRNAAKELNA